MEIEKIIRIVAIFLAIAAIGIRIATYVMFPESSSSFMPTTIAVCTCFWVVWRSTQKKSIEQTQPTKNRTR